MGLSMCVSWIGSSRWMNGLAGDMMYNYQVLSEFAFEQTMRTQLITVFKVHWSLDDHFIQTDLLLIFSGTTFPFSSSWVSAQVVSLWCFVTCWRAICMLLGVMKAIFYLPMVFRMWLSHSRHWGLCHSYSDPLMHVLMWCLSFSKLRFIFVFCLFFRTGCRFLHETVIHNCQLRVTCRLDRI